MTQQELRRLARLGAEARLVALQNEMQAIYRNFPDLRTDGPSPSPAASGNGAGADRPRRRRLSREARQRIAEAQRKRWAAFKAKNGDKGASAAPAEATSAAERPVARKKR